MDTIPNEGSSAPPPPSPAESMSEVCVPLSALAAEGADDSQTVSPAVGEPVEFTAAGKVSRVDGENAYVTLESVNGAPLAAKSMPKAGPDENDMRAMAAAADEEPQSNQ